MGSTTTRLAAAIALTFTGCGGAYAKVLAIVGPTHPSSIPPLPSGDSLADLCPEDTRYVVDDFDGNDVLHFQRYCANERGHTEGPFLMGDYIASRLRVQTGRLHKGRVDGRWFYFEGTPTFNIWCESTFTDLHRTGHLRGGWYGKRTEGDYDDQGRMHGPWVVDDKPFSFEHGTGPVAWYDVADGDVAGPCVNGLRDGPWRIEKDKVVIEASYAKGKLSGPARVLKKGVLEAEGELREGVMLHWRAWTPAACPARSRAEEARGERPRAQEPCLWSCVFEEGVCLHPQAETQEGPAPLPAAARALAADSRSLLPVALWNRDLRRCPAPRVAALGDNLIPHLGP